MDNRRRASTLTSKISDFNKRVAGLVLSHGDYPPAELTWAIRRGVLLPWRHYVTWLGSRSAYTRPDSELCIQWQDLHHGALAEHRAHEREMSLIPDKELSATTVAEFVELLRGLRDRAPGGVTALSRRSNISRSQIYAMTNSRKPVLPTRSDQVRAFLEGCGLSESQVAQGEQIWADLKENRADEARFSGEHKLLGLLHRIVVELAGMVDHDPGRKRSASRGMVRDAVAQVPVGSLASPDLLAMVLADAAQAVHAKATVNKPPPRRGAALSAGLGTSSGT